MFQRIWSLFRRQPRNIFRYHDGTNQRSIDPLVAWDSLWTDLDGLAIALPEATRGNQESQQIVEQIVARAFGLAIFDPATNRGLTKIEVQQLLDRYLNWMADLKKKTAQLPMPWRPTGLGFSAKQSPTKPDADSCSTSSESNSGEPS